MGTFSKIVDYTELGKRINVAFHDGNWDPVARQISKIVMSTGAVNFSVRTGAVVGKIIVLIWVASGFTGAGAAVAVVTIGASVCIDYASITK